jgi:hypothetical protein
VSDRKQIYKFHVIHNFAVNHPFVRQLPQLNANWDNNQLSLTLRLLTSYILVYGAPILDVSRSHTTTHHSWYDSSVRVMSSSQRPLPDNTRHSQQKNIQTSGRRPLDCSDRGFDSHRGHGYLSVASVACCQVEVSATS